MTVDPDFESAQEISLEHSKPPARIPPASINNPHFSVMQVTCPYYKAPAIAGRDSLPQTLNKRPMRCQQTLACYSASSFGVRGKSECP